MNFMSILSLILAVVVLFFIVMQVRTRIPRIVAFFTPGKRAMLFQDVPDPPINDINREMIKAQREKLLEMEFTELGVMLEKAPLWARSSQEMVLVSEKDRVIASLGLKGIRPSYFFYTPFQGGQVVVTAHNCFRNYVKPDFMTTEIKSGDLEEMLESHRRDVADFEAKGYQPFSRLDRDKVIEATRLYYQASYPKSQLRIAGFTNSIIFLLSILVFYLLVRGALG